MSNTTTDTSTIDEKKLNSTSSPVSLSEKLGRIGNFTLSVAIIFISILIYFSIGGYSLYLCKLAQTNILPTELNCAPYTDIQPDIKPIKTNIFTRNTDPETSMKLEFPYELNKENMILDMFKKYKEKPSSSFLANYFISIYESLTQFNYSIMNVIMNVMNETLPEALIICIGPIVNSILYAFGLLVNYLYLMYLWFSNMSWFFKFNSNAGENLPPKWESVSLMDHPIDWCTGLGLVFLFVTLFIIFLLFAAPILTIIPFFAYHNFLLSSFFYKGIMNNKKVSYFTIALDILKYYKIPIVILISIFIVLLAFSILGGLPGLFSILTLGLIYWGILTFDIFKPIPEDNLSPSVSYKQATKNCPVRGFLNKRKTLIQEIEGLFFGGGNIAKEIKKAGMKISSK